MKKITSKIKQKIKDNFVDILAIIIIFVIFYGATSIISWNNKRVANDPRYQETNNIAMNNTKKEI